MKIYIKVIGPLIVLMLLLVASCVAEQQPPEPEVMTLQSSTVTLRMSDQQFEVMKMLDLESGYEYQVALDEEGEQVDLQSILDEDKEAFFQEYGKIHPTLHEEMGRVGPSLVPIAVSLWIAFEESKVDKDQYQFDIQEFETLPPDHPLLQYREDILEAQSHVFALLSDMQITVDRVSKLAPVLYLELTPDQIEEVAALEEVGRLFLHEREGFLDLADSLSISNGDDVVAAGGDGSGIRLAVWERGPDPDCDDDLAIEGFYDGTYNSEHACLVTAIIKNTQANAPHGYAPDCLIYSANCFTRDALDWAVDDQSCQVVNQCFHRSSEQTSADLSNDDIYKDYLILHYPYPTILQAAGNDPPIAKDEYVNHKGYNSLAIGSHNDDATAMATSSVFRNPDSDNDDRELPELCANGMGVTAVGLSDSGTSFASPAVAGSVALLQERAGTLRYWPEGNRAILLAGARINVSGNTWWEDVYNDVDGSDGSGALDIEESWLIAGDRQYPDNTATPRGWDVGTLDDSDFDSYGYSTFVYRIEVPRLPMLPPLHVKVALAWNSEVTTESGSPTSSELTLDHDLRIYDEDDTLVAWSCSWDNSYEIAEFDGEPGIYTIKIHRWSGDGSTWYGIAWSAISEV